MTTTSKIKIALIGLIPLLGFALLPLNVFSHFDPAGVVDDSLPRGVLILLFTGLSALLTFGISLISRIIPDSIDKRVGAFLNYYGLSFGIWMLLMWVLVIVANNLGNGQISIIGVWVISLILVLPLGCFLLSSGKRSTRL